MQRELNGVPVVIAGDVFDRWDSPAELINFAIRHLPANVYAVCGQHDLPHHRYEDRKRSAYWTLVEAERITNLESGNEYCEMVSPRKVNSRDDVRSLYIYGYPWGFGLGPPPEKDKTGVNPLRLAVVHRYLWSDQTGSYPNAPRENHVEQTAEQLAGYDAAVFGDNHTPFLWNDGPAIFNHGCFIRRRTDERRLTPAAGVLYSDGTIECRPYVTAIDAWADAADTAVRAFAGAAADELMETLRAAADAPIVFRDIVLRAAAERKLPPDVAGALRGWVEPGE